MLHMTMVTHFNINIISMESNANLCHQTEKAAPR
jgi:hypothetical protein